MTIAIGIALAMNWDRPYWAGFASVVFSFDGGTDPVNAFDTAVMRARETALGMLVYTLVTTLLWPTGSRAGFEAATRALLQAQHRLYSAYRKALTGDRAQPGFPSQDLTEQDQPGQDLWAIAAQHNQALAQFGELLEAALTDSYEVSDLRRRWRRFQRQSTALLETLVRWRESSKELDTVIEIKGLDISAPDSNSGAGSLATPEAVHRSVSSSAPPAPIDRTGSGPFPDSDGMIALVRAMASLWLAYLLWIYIRVPDAYQPGIQSEPTVIDCKLRYRFS